MVSLFLFYKIKQDVIFFCQCFLQVKLVNISSNDIVDGNPKLTLGLVWSVILHWQVNQFGFLQEVEKCKINIVFSCHVL